MDEERPLNPDAERNPPDGEGLVKTATLRSITVPSYTCSTLTSAFNNFNVDADGVPRPKLRDILPQVLLLYHANQVHPGPSSQTWRLYHSEKWQYNE